MTIKQLTELCGFKDPKHFREDYMYAALEEGAIERLYPDTPNHPKQKYRLTEAALAWKKVWENKTTKIIFFRTTASVKNQDFTSISSHPSTFIHPRLLKAWMDKLTDNGYRKKNYLQY